MGPLDFLRGNKPSNEEEKQLQAQTHGGIVVSAVQTRQRTAQEAEDRQNKGMDLVLLEATETLGVLDSLETFKINLPRLNTATNLIYYELSPKIDRLWVKNLKVLLDTVIATFMVSPFEAETLKRRAHLGCFWIAEEMETEELSLQTIYGSGYTDSRTSFQTLIFNVETVILGTLEGTINGNKPYLIKVKQESLVVKTSHGVLPNEKKH